MVTGSFWFTARFERQPFRHNININMDGQAGSDVNQVEFVVAGGDDAGFIIKMIVRIRSCSSSRSPTLTVTHQSTK